MEWFVSLAPVPNAVEFNAWNPAVFWALLLAALAPVFLVLRHAIGGRAPLATPHLRVIDGGRELRQHAA